MPVLPIRELRDLSLACRRIEPTADQDLVLAEAAALLLWAEERGCAPPELDVWCVLDAEGEPGRFEVGIALNADTPGEDGLIVRRLPATTFAVAPGSLDHATVRERAAHLATWPVTPFGRVPASGPLWLRIDPVAATATLWLPLRETRQNRPGWN